MHMSFISFYLEAICRCSCTNEQSEHGFCASAVIQVNNPTFAVSCWGWTANTARLTEEIISLFKRCWFLRETAALCLSLNHMVQQATENTSWENERKEKKEQKHQRRILEEQQTGRSCLKPRSVLHFWHITEDLNVQEDIWIGLQSSGSLFRGGI